MTVRARIPPPHLFISLKRFFFSFSPPRVFCLSLSRAPSPALPRPPSLKPPPRYLFPLSSPFLLSPDFEQHCGGCPHPLRWMRATVTLTDKHRDSKAHISHFLTHTQSGVPSTEGKKESELYCTPVRGDKMTVGVSAALHQILSTCC